MKEKENHLVRFKKLKIRDKQVMGKYLAHTKRTFKISEVLHIRSMITKGVRITKIAEEYRTDYKTINRIFEEFSGNFIPIRTEKKIDRLGHKDEPYYRKESDMLIPDYTWESLSETEKEWYLARPDDEETVGRR